MTGARAWALPAVLLAVGVGWGATQPLGKIATSGGAGPFGLIFWQLVVCVLVLGGLTLARGKGLPLTWATLRFYLIVAVLGTLVPNATFYISVSRLPSGIMSILISTVPMLAFPIALLLRTERFSVRRLGGLALGLAGVALIALPGTSLSGPSLPDPAMAAFLPLALVGPLFYALEGTYVARFGTAGMDAVQAMFGASVAGLVLCLPMALALGQFYLPFPAGRAEAALVLSSALHGLLYASYVWLAARAGAVFAAQTSYIVTGSGVLWAMLLLGERISPLVGLALVIMLCGVALVRPSGRKTVSDTRQGLECSA
ncbi:DMT family transporter [Xinfangfangia pollutisoli]|uniref:DMT family transporter n=1 Tax=Xinfangfangia pollutisoli TaxID=2865960 RepID=UPI001CD64DFF|nr:DMT family transporter [Xinfangfangia pollutisoli]